MTHKITGIILCGGKSSRMGSDKGLVEYNGHAMVNYAIQLFEELGYDIVLSTNNETYAKFGYPLIKDKFLECGPLGGLHASLTYSDTPWNAVIPCDLPLMETIVYNEIYNAIQEGICYTAICESKEHPLVGFYHQDMLELIEENLNEKRFKMIDFLKENNNTYINIDKKHAMCFTNFNTLNDIAGWK